MKELRRSQVDQRVDELHSLVNDLAQPSPKLHQKIFGTASGAQMDIKELVVTGHSFGGITALITASRLGSDCRACCVMDPWLYAYAEEFNEGKITLSCPVQVINSEYFHPTIPTRVFDSWETLKQILKHSLMHQSNPLAQENLIVNKNGHMNQVDQAAFQTWDLSVIHGRRPITWAPRLYQLNSRLWLSFLGRLDQKQNGQEYFDPQKAF